MISRLLSNKSTDLITNQLTDKLEFGMDEFEFCDNRNKKYLKENVILSQRLYFKIKFIFWY